MSWFVWADDIGPDGKVRRTTGDLFFAEVRPFEEIFREGQSMSRKPSSSSNNSSNPVRAATRRRKLADLQKQIISATWKLFRQSGQSLQPGFYEARNRGEQEPSGAIEPKQQPDSAGTPDRALRPVDRGALAVCPAGS